MSETKTNLQLVKEIFGNKYNRFRNGPFYNLEEIGAKFKQDPDDPFWIPDEIVDMFTNQSEYGPIRAYMFFEDIAITVTNGTCRAFRNKAVLFLSLATDTDGYTNISEYDDIDTLIKCLNPVFFSVDRLSSLTRIRCHGDKCGKMGDNDEWCISCNGEFTEDLDYHLQYFHQENIKVSDICEEDVLFSFITQEEITGEDLIPVLTEKVTSTQNLISSNESDLNRFEMLLKSLPESISNIREEITENQNLIQLIQSQISNLNENVHETERLRLEEMGREQERQRQLTVQRKLQEIERLQNEINQLK